jgi:hypothetical protein
LNNCGVERRLYHSSGLGYGYERASSNREDGRLQATCRTRRNVSHRLKSRQLHKAGIARLCSIQSTHRNM